MAFQTPLPNLSKEKTKVYYESKLSLKICLSSLLEAVFELPARVLKLIFIKLDLTIGQLFQVHCKYILIQKCNYVVVICLIFLLLLSRVNFIIRFQYKNIQELL